MEGKDDRKIEKDICIPQESKEIVLQDKFLEKINEGKNKIVRINGRKVIYFLLLQLNVSCLNSNTTIMPRPVNCTFFFPVCPHVFCSSKTMFPIT